MLSEYWYGVQMEFHHQSILSNLTFIRKIEYSFLFGGSCTQMGLRVSANAFLNKHSVSVHIQYILYLIMYNSIHTMVLISWPTRCYVYFFLVKASPLSNILQFFIPGGCHYSSGLWLFIHFNFAKHEYFPKAHAKEIEREVRGAGKELE